MVKACKDCRNFLKDETGMTFHRCSAFQDNNPVTGEISYLYCATARTYERYCGERGKQWTTSATLINLPIDLASLKSDYERLNWIEDAWFSRKLNFYFCIACAIGSLALAYYLGEQEHETINLTPKEGIHDQNTH
jgi:hypothetical protein